MADRSRLPGLVSGESPVRAAILEQYGDNADFKLADLPEPSVRAGHVVVRVAATSVNTVDTMIRSLGQENPPIAPDLSAARAQLTLGGR